MESCQQPVASEMPQKHPHGKRNILPGAKQRLQVTAVPLQVPVAVQTSAEVHAQSNCSAHLANAASQRTWAPAPLEPPHSAIQSLMIEWRPI